MNSASFVKKARFIGRKVTKEPFPPFLQISHISYIKKRIKVKTRVWARDFRGICWLGVCLSRRRDGASWRKFLFSFPPSKRSQPGSDRRGIKDGGWNRGEKISLISFTENRGVVEGQINEFFVAWKGGERGGRGSKKMGSERANNLRRGRRRRRKRQRELSIHDGDTRFPFFGWHIWERKRCKKTSTLFFLGIPLPAKSTCHGRLPFSLFLSLSPFSWLALIHASFRSSLHIPFSSFSRFPLFAPRR